MKNTVLIKTFDFLKFNLQFNSQYTALYGLSATGKTMLFNTVESIQRIVKFRDRTSKDYSDIMGRMLSQEECDIFRKCKCINIYTAPEEIARMTFDNSLVLVDNGDAIPERSVLIQKILNSDCQAIISIRSIKDFPYKRFAWATLEDELDEIVLKYKCGW